MMHSQWYSANMKAYNGPRELLRPPPASAKTKSKTFSASLMAYWRISGLRAMLSQSCYGGANLLQQSSVQCSTTTFQMLGSDLSALYTWASCPLFRRSHTPHMHDTGIKSRKWWVVRLSKMREIQRGGQYSRRASVHSKTVW